MVGSCRHLPYLSRRQRLLGRSNQLGSKGTASQRKDDSRMVSAYFPQVQFDPSDFEQFKTDLLRATDSAVQVSWQTIDNEDWAKSWKTLLAG